MSSFNASFAPLPILAVTSADRVALYGALARQLPIELLQLASSYPINLRHALAHLDISRYHCVLLDLPFCHVRGQSRFLARLPRLVIYQRDACRTLPGPLKRFFRSLPLARVVVTGAGLAEQLRVEGFAARFLPNGFDRKRLFIQGQPRDIGLGVIEPSDRCNTLLEQLVEVEPLQRLRTEPGDAYRHLLNRIQVFVSANAGVGEFMANNIEAMACGCLVLAWRQGMEEAAIGLEDGKHLLLYSSITELRCHLARLRREPWLRQSVAQNGRAFVEQQLSYEHVAAGLARVLREPVRIMPQPTFWQQGWVQKMGLAFKPQKARG